MKHFKNFVAAAFVAGAAVLAVPAATADAEPFCLPTGSAGLGEECGLAPGYEPYGPQYPGYGPGYPGYGPVGPPPGYNPLAPPKQCWLPWQDPYWDNCYDGFSLFPFQL